MIDFTDKLSTTKKLKWKNTCEYIIVHHTGGWSYKGNCNVLSWSNGDASCHFVIWPKGETAKIGDPSDILRHAWISSWWNLENMNKYSIWIEIVWPNSQWQFSNEQFRKLVELIRHLQKTYGIPKENILKHSDITSLAWLSEKKQLWDWKSKARKVDVAPSLRQSRWIPNRSEFLNIFFGWQ